MVETGINKVLSPTLSRWTDQVVLMFKDNAFASFTTKLSLYFLKPDTELPLENCRRRPKQMCRNYIIR